MQNHTTICIALYSLQNAFTYTSSFIPPSLPFIHLLRNIFYKPGTMLDTEDTKNEEDIQVYTLFKEFMISWRELMQKIRDTIG